MLLRHCTISLKGLSEDQVNALSTENWRVLDHALRLFRFLESSPLYQATKGFRQGELMYIQSFLWIYDGFAEKRFYLQKLPVTEHPKKMISSFTDLQNFSEKEQSALHFRKILYFVCANQVVCSIVFAVPLSLVEERDYFAICKHFFSINRNSVWVDIKWTNAVFYEFFIWSGKDVPSAEEQRY